MVENGYVTKLELTNIRGFCETTLHFTNADDSPRMRTLIIGKNGTCKTTLLRSIVLGLGASEDISVLVGGQQENYVRQGTKEGKIFMMTTTGAVSSVTLGGTLFGRRRHTLEFPVHAYGVSRTRGGGTESNDKPGIISSTATLFSDDHGLADPELTLRRLQDFAETKRYNATMDRIKLALGLGSDDRIEFKRGGGVVVSGPEIGNEIPLDSVADGYRLTLRMILDIYANAMAANQLPDDGDLEGILLIDELDQHLHPSIQVEILPRLSALFPKMQIIATTHSPMVALGAEEGELISLKRSGDEVEAVAVDRAPNLLSVEDIIEDADAFDTDPLGPKLRTDLEEYRSLVQIPRTKRNAEQKKRIGVLAKQLRANEMALPGEDVDPVLSELAEIRKKLGV